MLPSNVNQVLGFPLCNPQERGVHMSDVPSPSRHRRPAHCHHQGRLRLRLADAVAQLAAGSLVPVPRGQGQMPRAHVLKSVVLCISHVEVFRVGISITRICFIQTMDLIKMQGSDQSDWRNGGSGALESCGLRRFRLGGSWCGTVDAYCKWINGFQRKTTVNCRVFQVSPKKDPTLGGFQPSPKGFSVFGVEWGFALNPLKVKLRLVLAIPWTDQVH